MTDKPIPIQLFERGFTDLVSVIPPGAKLTPSSKIPQTHVGKIPGIRLANGLWCGYNWRKHQATIDDVRKWTRDQANVGLRADVFPAVDIDCLDESLAQDIETFTLDTLGLAPRRIGKYPKRLLLYRTEEPFGRMRLWIKSGAESHLVEVLGQGQQFLVHGLHPATQAPYTWQGNEESLRAFTAGPDHLTVITREQVDAYLTKLGEYLDMLGVGSVEREGDGRPPSHTPADQVSLRAPSVDALREAVAAIPNNNELFPDRTSYLKMGYAIRAAAGEDIDAGYELFAEWASRWEGNDRFAGNDPDTVLADWRRMRGAAAVGWAWIAELAGGHGFDTASLDFEATALRPDETLPAAPLHSDQWLAQRVAEHRRGEMRYVPQTERYVVWDGTRWEPDALHRAEDVIKRELRLVADSVLRHGATGKEKKDAEKLATAICTAGKVSAVASLLRSDPAIAIALEALDHDPWSLCTPAGIVDLHTGKLTAPSPDALCSKSTSVAPDFSADCPRWRSFLSETTGGDSALEAYLQRLCGYALTGSTREQQITLLYGTGGNGKGTFLRALDGILADYAHGAQMKTFMATRGDQHPTSIAAMVGARVVIAEEAGDANRWNEAMLKELSGGGRVTARFMHKDEFRFTPQFKLIFAANHKPELHIDDAMRRRLHLVPFVQKPRVVDQDLDGKLAEEWPAILAWMIEGCLLWQEEGLAPPESVRASTEEYFAEEDAIGRWLAECCETTNVGGTATQDLFRSWSEWANQNGEHPRTTKRFAMELTARKYRRWRDPHTRRNGFEGVAIKRQDVEDLL